MSYEIYYYDLNSRTETLVAYWATLEDFTKMPEKNEYGHYFYRRIQDEQV